MEHSVSRSSIKLFTRANTLYEASYNQKGALVRLIKKGGDGKGEFIPSHTQTFRRLADGNRGGKFTPVS